MCCAQDCYIETLLNRERTVFRKCTWLGKKNPGKNPNWTPPTKKNQATRSWTAHGQRWFLALERNSACLYVHVLFQTHSRIYILLRSVGTRSAIQQLRKSTRENRYVAAVKKKSIVVVHVHRCHERCINERQGSTIPKDCSAIRTWKHCDRTMHWTGAFCTESRQILFSSWIVNLLE